MKATEEAHPDFGNLGIAFEQMNKVLEGINSNKADFENLERIQEVQDQFVNLTEDVSTSSSSFSPAFFIFISKLY